MRRMLTILLAVAVVVAACTSTETTTTPAPATSAPTSTTTTMPATTQAPTSTTTDPATERAVRSYDVGGVEVIVMTETDELPQRAEIIEYSTTLIDEGAGPKLCLGGILLSLPPQCFGPVIEDYEISGWAEEASGVYFGQRNVIVSWPPIEDRVALVADSEFQSDEMPYPPGELPTHCAGIEDFVSNDAIQQYSRALGDQTGGLYVANDGELVLQVIDDPEQHRTALRADGQAACVVQVDHTEKELLQIQQDLNTHLFGDDSASSLARAMGIYSSVPAAGGRLELEAVAVDLETVQAITALVDDPTAIRIIGKGIIVDQ